MEHGADVCSRALMPFDLIAVNMRLVKRRKLLCWSRALHGAAPPRFTAGGGVASALHVFKKRGRRAALHALSGLSRSLCGTPGPSLTEDTFVLRALLLQHENTHPSLTCLTTTMQKLAHGCGSFFFSGLFLRALI